MSSFTTIGHWAKRDRRNLPKITPGSQQCRDQPCPWRVRPRCSVLGERERMVLEDAMGD